MCTYLKTTWGKWKPFTSFPKSNFLWGITFQVFSKTTKLNRSFYKAAAINNAIRVTEPTQWEIMVRRNRRSLPVAHISRVGKQKNARNRIIYYVWLPVSRLTQHYYFKVMSFVSTSQGDRKLHRPVADCHLQYHAQENYGNWQQSLWRFQSFITDWTRTNNTIKGLERESHDLITRIPIP